MNEFKNEFKMDYRNFKTSTVIGMEVHVQLNTKTKLFCGCSISAEKPNSSTCPICLGHPGAKPCTNKEALIKAVRLAVSLNATVGMNTRFSRKTYFYPDMSKNYQITQYEEPLALNGSVVLDSGKKIRIKRIHLEEDPAALIHNAGGVLVDYNRSGIPLVEIVTEPDITSPEEAREFMKSLLTIVNYLDIFNENDGIIKADANISVQKHNYERVEVKNITGFKEIEKALSYEVARQQKEDVVMQETRGWNSEKGITHSQRIKETEEDYGYIYEPDLPPLTITSDEFAQLKKTLPELPREKMQRYIHSLKIDEGDAKIITEHSRKFAELFERIAKIIYPLFAGHWFRREVLRVMNDKGKTSADINEKQLIILLKLLQDKKITQRIGQQLIEQIADKDFDVERTIKEEKLIIINDEKALMEHCKTAIVENKKAAEDYLKGEEKAFNFLVGCVMKKTKGQARPEEIRELLKTIIKIKK